MPRLDEDVVLEGMAGGRGGGGEKEWREESKGEEEGRRGRTERDEAESRPSRGKSQRHGEGFGDTHAVRNLMTG